jgi:hypothetical protein
MRVGLSRHGRAAQPDDHRFPTHLTTGSGGRRLLVDSRFPRHLPICFRGRDLCRVAHGVAGPRPSCRSQGSRSRKGGQRCQEDSNPIGGRSGGRKRSERSGRKRSARGKRRGKEAVRRSRGSNPKSQDPSPALLLPKVPPLAPPHSAGRPGLPKPGRIREVSPGAIVPSSPAGQTARPGTDAGF